MPATDVRLALVMNGGISLAVWMGGVTHELDLLRRASGSLRDGVPLDAEDDPWAPDEDSEREVYRAWKQLCDDLDLHVTIDVVAGSSAGGLNGTLLAKAIATGGRLPNLRDVWSELAALKEAKLLRGLSAPHDSVLDGAFFSREVAGLINGIKPTVAPGNMSLFVTATAVSAQGRRWADLLGKPFIVDDHRRLYRFRRRPTWQQDTATRAISRTPRGLDEFEHAAELAAAARASAGFPVAFGPVPEWSAQSESPAYDLRPLRHPAIGEPASVATEGPAWLMDGGVLDNAPFGPVLEEVSQQNVDSPWRRALIYIVPSGDPTPPPPDDLGVTGPPWTTAIGATIWFPREVDVRGDVEQVEELMQRTARWVQAPDELFNRMMVGDGNGSADESAAAMTQAAAALAEQYRQSRTRAGILDALSLWRSDDPVVRLVAQPHFRVEALHGSNWVPPAGSPDRPMTSSGSAPWLWGTAVADRVLRMLLRHLRFAAEQTDLPGCLAAIDKLGEAVQHCVALREAIEYEVRARIPSPYPRSPAEQYEAARLAIEDAVRVCEAPRILGELMREAAESYRTVLDLSTDAAGVLARVLTVEVVTRAFADRERFDRPVDFEFHRFGPDCETDLFRADQLGGALGDWKLWGTHFGHFGAFGAAKWRRWDWRWGRLDGAHHLFNLLTCGLDDDTSRGLQSQRDKLFHAILGAEKDGPDIESTLRTMESTLRDELWEYRRRGPDLLARARKEDPEVRDAAKGTVQAVLQLLRQDDPNLPAAVRTAGQFLGYAFWPERPRTSLPGKGVPGWLMRRGLRWFGRKPRRRLYDS